MSYKLNRSPVKNDGCNYSKLGDAQVPVQNVNKYYLVPNYYMPTYDTLTHGNVSSSCNGYFKIRDAYEYGTNRCPTTYSYSSRCN